MFEALSLRPGHLYARAAGATELLGGALFARGLPTPAGAALVIAVMVTALVTVHLRNGIWIKNGGFEYDVVIIAAAFALAGVGPGHWSLDNALGIDWSSTGWALSALGVGVIGGLGAVISGRMAAAREGRAAPSHPA